MQDIQRAIQWVREHAAEYPIDTGKVGVMGFSAGGHLAMSAGIYYDTDYLAPLGIVARVSLRPDFVASIYPVVTFSDKRYVHKRSRRGLLGEWCKSDTRMQDSLSLEKHVRADGPPVFLLNCMDDPVVKYQNSLLLDSALTARHVPHKYIQYKTGGHGFGADGNKGTQESRAWKKAFLDWLKALFQ
jgi:acetyl esterase/lipase